MALSEQEELELLTLERDQAQGGKLSSRVGASLRMNVPETITKAAYATGGAVTDLAAKYFPPEVAAGLGYAANVGVEAVPALFGMGAGKSASPAFDKSGKWLMKNAVKPSLEDLRSGKAASGVKTMLDEGVNATRGGYDILRGKIDDITGQVDNLLAQYPNATVDKNKVGATLAKVISKIEKTNPTPNMQRKAVEEI